MKNKTILLLVLLLLSILAFSCSEMVDGTVVDKFYVDNSGWGGAYRSFYLVIDDGTVIKKYPVNSDKYYKAVVGQRFSFEYEY